MIPYSYNMVDMGGIDLAEVNGTVVYGLYNRLAVGRNACGDLILYNWKFAGIEIAPSAWSTLDEGTSIIINGVIKVTDEDVVIIITLEPDPPVIEPLDIQENGVYNPPAGVDGYAPVTVNVTGVPVEIMEQGQVSTTRDYATAYYGSGIDPTQYDALAVTLWKLGNKIGTGAFLPVGSSQKILGSDNITYTFTTTATSISCTNYAGDWFDLYVDVYGVSLPDS